MSTLVSRDDANIRTLADYLTSLPERERRTWVVAAYETWRQERGRFGADPWIVPASSEPVTNSRGN